MKKNSCTPINPKKYSCYDLKKINARNLMTKKSSCGSKIPTSPITFLMVRPLLADERRGDKQHGLGKRDSRQPRLQGAFPCVLGTRLDPRHRSDIGRLGVYRPPGVMKPRDNPLMVVTSPCVRVSWRVTKCNSSH